MRCFELLGAVDRGTEATTLDNIPPNTPAAPTISNLAATTLTVNWTDPVTTSG